MAKNSIRTHKPIATTASKALRSGATSHTTKRLAGSALANRKSNSQRKSSR